VVDEVTHKSVRQVAKTFTDRFRKEFLTCLDISRRPAGIDDAFGCADAADNITTVPRNGNRVQDRHGLPEITVHIGGFDLVCLNYGSRIVMKLCGDTVNFIAEWVLPLLRELARSQDSQQLEAETATEELCPRTLQGFHFCASKTPNIRDKVCWNPLRHSWEVCLKKAKGTPNKKFAVDPELTPLFYEEQKLAMYVAATAAWNRLDGSNRHRIQATLESHGVP